MLNFLMSSLTGVPITQANSDVSEARVMLGRFSNRFKPGGLKTKTFFYEYRILLYER